MQRAKAKREAIAKSTLASECEEALTTSDSLVTIESTTVTEYSHCFRALIASDANGVAEEGDRGTAERSRGGITGSRPSASLSFSSTTLLAVDDALDPT